MSPAVSTTSFPLLTGYSTTTVALPSVAIHNIFTDEVTDLLDIIQTRPLTIIGTHNYCTPIYILTYSL